MPSPFFTSVRRGLVARLPYNATRLPGQSAALQIVAFGDAPLAYQWHCNATNIPDATNATLSLTNLALFAGRVLPMRGHK